SASGAADGLQSRLQPGVVQAQGAGCGVKAVLSGEFHRRGPEGFGDPRTMRASAPPALQLLACLLHLDGKNGGVYGLHQSVLLALVGRQTDVTRSFRSSHAAVPKAHGTNTNAQGPRYRPVEARTRGGSRHPTCRIRSSCAPTLPSELVQCTSN